MRMRTLFMILFAVLLGALLFYGYSASAAVIEQWAPTGNLENIGQGGDSTANTYDGFIFTVPIPTTITTITLKTPQAQGLVSPNSMDYALISSAGTVLASQTVTNQPTIAAATEYTIDVPDTAVAAGTYFFGSNYNSGTGVVKGYTSSTSAYYTGGCLFENQATTTFSLASCSGEKRSVYFKINNTNTNAINITYPVDGSTGMDNFGLWNIAYYTDTDNTFTNIYVHTTSTVSNGNYLFLDQEPNFDSNGVLKTKVLNRLNSQSYASGTTYYAKAYLYGTSSLLATSPTISFSIGDVDEELIFPVLPTPNFILGAEDNTASELCTKFPFSYWCDFTAIWAGLTATTTSSSLPVLAIVLPTGSGSATTSIPIISASGISTWLGASTVALMRSLIQLGLYLAFGLYVYERIKHFHL